MNLLENDVISYYRKCDYWPVERMPLRPRELHIPIILAQQLKESNVQDLFDTIADRKLTIDLTPDSCEWLAPVLLHESLFHFYKAFYNYLAARALYFSGLDHWIAVTLYYARFYLARSITILAGKHSYGVDKEQAFYVPQLASLLAKSGKQSPHSHRIRLELDVKSKSGVVIVDTERVSSHRDVWHDYRTLDVVNLGLYSLMYDQEGNDSLFGIQRDYLLQERHKENYSFEGYWSLDFNLTSESFVEFYGDLIRNTKRKANQIYDLESCDVFLAFSSQYRLYKKLEIPNLPIEQQKFQHMIQTFLPNSPAKENLSLLCSEGFPNEQLFSEDGEVFCDELGRTL